MAASETIEAQAAVIRSSGALGRSAGLNRLFDYLVAASASDARPKEVEIALAVFGRDTAFDGAQDASVRVSMHRLRKKLEDFYAGPGRDQPARLSIPKGEYRIVADEQAAAPAPPAPRRWPWIAAAAGALLVALNLAAWAWLGQDRSPAAEVRRLAPWSELVGSGRPLIVVVGDYYIFGETDPKTGVNRLVREYGINSHEDLDAWLMENTEAPPGQYRDLDLYYLPVGAAFALKDIIPVVAERREDVRVVMASDLTSDMLRRNDIVYVGYLSGLGALREPVFAASRLSIGDTYDELVDARSGTTYSSQEGGPSAGGTVTQRDYGYVASFPGPEGNRILVVAGARDMGLMQTAEAISTREGLRALLAQTRHAPAFEALYEAEGIRRSSLGGRLVLVSPLDPQRIWNGPRRELRFPAG